MDWFFAAVARSRFISLESYSRDIQTELFRKSIHVLIAFVPFFAEFSVAATVALLGAATIGFAYSEFLRGVGVRVFVISRITIAASRNRDIGKFALGPITLAIGAMLALLLYPEPAATIAIFALAFGDSLSSIVGKIFGRIRIPFSGGKTVAGSIACFLSVLIVSYRITGDLRNSLIISVSAAALEALPLKDFDNILLPVGTGFIASRLLFLTG